MERTHSGGYRRFFLSWLESPRSVGAVAPSGRPLARLMARELVAGARVVELGPGTGTLTRAILGRGIAECDLVLIERFPRFVAALERQFPAATIVCGDATEPQAALATLKGRVDFVVSGLPLVLFTREQKVRLLTECFDLLRDEGALFQFTYGGRCPIDRQLLSEHGLRARCIGFIALNVPPAFVYRISRNDF